MGHVLPRRCRSSCPSLGSRRSATRSTTVRRRSTSNGFAVPVGERVLSLLRECLDIRDPKRRRGPRSPLLLTNLGAPMTRQRSPCANVATLAACDARTDCHSVFVDPGTCGCNAVGCCARFSRCADGGKALCKGTPICQIATPYCEAPANVVSYTASCYEGCVRPRECAP